MTVLPETIKNNTGDRKTRTANSNINIKNGDSGFRDLFKNNHSQKKPLNTFSFLLTDYIKHEYIQYRMVIFEFKKIFALKPV